MGSIGGKKISMLGWDAEGVRIRPLERVLCVVTFWSRESFSSKSLGSGQDWGSSSTGMSKKKDGSRLKDKLVN